MKASALADLHARCFSTRPRPWTEAEFDEYLAATHVTILGDDLGFLVLRVIAPEAEILTIAVDPAHRQQGRGRDLLEEAEKTASTAGATEVYLEVSEANTAARRLYAVSGYQETGRRKDYYGAGGRDRETAVVLRKRIA